MADLVLTDPCGNPLPISISIGDFAIPSIPAFPLTLADLLKLLGIELPTIDATIPCPILLDRARDASPAASLGVP